MTRQLTISYDDEVLANLGLSANDFAGEAKFLLAAKLYELGKLTSGQAARFCDLSRVAFLFALSRAGIPASNLTPDELADELRFAHE